MGGAALGARLRRLSAVIDADAARIYAAQGIKFEQRWYGVINQLAMKGPLSVRDLAALLGISHASVSETAKSLKQAGLITAHSDPDDSRRSVLSLSRSGKALVAKLRPLWDAFDAAARELDAEAGEVSAALARLEDVLQRKSLQARIAEHLQILPRGALKPSLTTRAVYFLSRPILNS
ncbi:DNA-binding MarR family transcriptional regulator [Rhizomicrobium palustre]|uniref:DNA-binding MarR family transcriptional regulator n=1 Tax=Rhizomicrobium palustre TaxID=189966 RepID=A0A846N4K4_9PROT|nr:MarR family transcriptional regulator [Rhizomicrobium palustre]NIK90017.1 DNA-binding MarR family transcriptional regulator [Rhizomicrobium palustre]